MERVLSERLLLPENVTWEEVESSKTFPHPSDLCYVIPFALACILIRYLFTRFIFIPFGEYYGLKNKAADPVPEHPILDKAFKQKRTNKYEVEKLAAQLRWTVRQVEVWLRLKKKMYRFTEMSKFTESAWRLVYYTSASLYAIVFFLKEPWFWNRSLLFAKKSTETEMTPALYWFNLIQLGFGVSLLMRQLFDVRRKDFCMMFIHHVYFITLTSLAWIVNSILIGTVILFIHDLTDVSLEATKCCIYLKRKTLQSVCFITFVLIWIVLRLICFPLLVHTFYKDAFPYMAFLPYIIMTLSLVGLQVLHIIWSKMILDMFLQSLKTQEFSDVRSESEESSSDEAKTK